MNTIHSSAPSWSTSSFGHESSTFAGELATLGAHLDLCRRANGKLLTIQCWTEALKAFVTSRVVTTLFLMALAMALGSVML